MMPMMEPNGQYYLLSRLKRWQRIWLPVLRMWVMRWKRKRREREVTMEILVPDFINYRERKPKWWQRWWMPRLVRWQMSRKMWKR